MGCTGIAPGYAAFQTATNLSQLPALEFVFFEIASVLLKLQDN